MKRRGFFGAFAGLIAAPVAAVALKQTEDLLPDEPIPVAPVVAPKRMRAREAGMMFSFPSYCTVGASTEVYEFNCPGQDFDEDDEDGFMRSRE